MSSPRAIPHVEAALAKSARERFQHRYAEPLTDEDGREIATNLLGMFALLRKWRDRRDGIAAPSGNTAPAPRGRRSTPSAE